MPDFSTATGNRILVKGIPLFVTQVFPVAIKMISDN